MIYKREFCSYVFIKVNGLHTIELNGNAQLNGNELVQEQSRQQETSVCSGWVSHKFRILQKKRIWLAMESQISYLTKKRYD